jgi:hypothetical protein
MSELYWITRCDPIGTAALVFLIISSVLLGLLIIGYAACSSDKDESGISLAKKLLKIVVPVFTVSLLVEVFIPTTKEALVIYGVGGTVDYLKSNPTAKKLPDKCINALDKWVDSFTSEKNDSTKKK